MITLTQAVELTGKSKSTLTRAIKSGQLSAKRSDDGRTYLVDPAELARAFEFVKPIRQDSPVMNQPGDVTHQGGSPSDEPNLHHDSPLTNDDEPLGELAKVKSRALAYKAIAQQLRMRVKTAEDALARAEDRLDQSERERRQQSAQITALLTHQQESESDKPLPRQSQTAGWWLTAGMMATIIAVALFAWSDEFAEAWEARTASTVAAVERAG